MFTRKTYNVPYKPLKKPFWEYAFLLMVYQLLMLVIFFLPKPNEDNFTYYFQDAIIGIINNLIVTLLSEIKILNMISVKIFLVLFTFISIILSAGYYGVWSKSKHNILSIEEIILNRWSFLFFLFGLSIGVILTVLFYTSMYLYNHLVYYYNHPRLTIINRELMGINFSRDFNATGYLMILIILISAFISFILMIGLLFHRIFYGKSSLYEGGLIVGNNKVEVMLEHLLDSERLVEFLVGLIMFTLSFQYLTFPIHMDMLSQKINEELCFSSIFLSLSQIINREDLINTILVGLLFASYPMIVSPIIDSYNNIDSYIEEKIVKEIMEVFSNLKKHVVIMGYGKLGSYIGNETVKIIHKLYEMPGDNENSRGIDEFFQKHTRVITLPNFEYAYILNSIVAITDDISHLDYNFVTEYGDTVGLIKLRPTFFLKRCVDCDFYIPVILNDASNEEAQRMIRFQEASLVVSTIGEGAEEPSAPRKFKTVWGKATTPLISQSTFDPQSDRLLLVRMYDTIVYEATAPIDIFTNLHTFNTSDLLSKYAKSLIMQSICSINEKCTLEKGTKPLTIMFISSRSKVDITVRAIVRELLKAFKDFKLHKDAQQIQAGANGDNKANNCTSKYIENIVLVMPSEYYLRTSKKLKKSDEAACSFLNDRVYLYEMPLGRIVNIEFLEDTGCPNFRFYFTQINFHVLYKILSKVKPDIIVLGEHTKEDILGSFADLLYSVKKVKKGDQSFNPLIITAFPQRTLNFYNLVDQHIRTINELLKENKHFTSYSELHLETIHAIGTYLLGLIHSFLTIIAGNNSTDTTKGFVSLNIRVKDEPLVLPITLGNLGKLKPTKIRVNAIPKREEGTTKINIFNFYNILTFFSRSNKIIYNLIGQGYLRGYDPSKLEIFSRDDKVQAGELKELRFEKQKKYLLKNIHFGLLTNYITKGPKSSIREILSIDEDLYKMTRDELIKKDWPVYDEYSLSDLAIKGYLNAFKKQTHPEILDLYNEIIFLNPKVVENDNSSDKNSEKTYNGNKSEDDLIRFYVYILGLSFPGSLSKLLFDLNNIEYEDIILRGDNKGHINGDGYLDINSILFKEIKWDKNKIIPILRELEIHGIYHKFPKCSKYKEKLKNNILELLSREFPLVPESEALKMEIDKMRKKDELDRTRIPSFKVLKIKEITSRSDHEGNTPNNILESHIQKVVKTLNERLSDGLILTKGNKAYSIGKYLLVKLGDWKIIALDPLIATKRTTSGNQEGSVYEISEITPGVSLFIKDDDNYNLTNQYLPRLILSPSIFLLYHIAWEYLFGVKNKLYKRFFKIDIITMKRSFNQLRYGLIRAIRAIENRKEKSRINYIYVYIPILPIDKVLSHKIVCEELKNIIGNFYKNVLFASNFQQIFTNMIFNGLSGESRVKDETLEIPEIRTIRFSVNRKDTILQIKFEDEYPDDKKSKSYKFNDIDKYYNINYHKVIEFRLFRTSYDLIEELERSLKLSRRHLLYSGRYWPYALYINELNNDQQCTNGSFNRKLAKFRESLQLIQVRKFIDVLSKYDANTLLLSEKIFKMYNLIPPDLTDIPIKYYSEGIPSRYYQVLL
ncbi:MAG: hypothetical protein ACP6IP_00140 [Candidatus Njordarchaeia archaeon]